MVIKMGKTNLEVELIQSWEELCDCTNAFVGDVDAVGNLGDDDDDDDGDDNDDDDGDDDDDDDDDDAVGTTKMTMRQ